MKTQNNRSPRAWQRSLHDASPYLTLGVQLAGAMLFYVGVGYLLDRWLDTTPWLLVAGSVVGMIAFFVQVFRVVARMNRESEAASVDRDAG